MRNNTSASFAGSSTGADTIGDPALETMLARLDASLRDHDTIEDRYVKPDLSRDGQPVLRRVLADARDLPWPDDSADAGPMACIPGKQDRVAAFRRLARVVRPGGRLFVQFFLGSADCGR